MPLRFRAGFAGGVVISAISCAFVSVANARGETPSAAPAHVEALAIDVEPGAGSLDADALRTAIAQEVGVPVTSAVSTSATRLLIRSEGPDGLRFQLVDPSGRVVERDVDLGTVAKGSALDTAALVAATLL